MGRIKDFLYSRPAWPKKKAALIYAVIVETVFIGIVPFCFLFIRSLWDLQLAQYPQPYIHYNDGERYVVTKKGIRFSNYYNNTTKEKSDGTKIRVPPGTKLEVAIIHFDNYPEEPAYITTSFYECESGVYTLWGGIKLDWIENPEVINQDIEAHKAKEANEKKICLLKTVAGLVLTIVITGTVVFLVWKLLKKREELHYLFIVLLIVAAMFFLNPFGFI